MSVASPDVKILKKFTCKRCGYSWYSPLEDGPVTCASPKCRSPFWRTEKTRFYVRKPKAPSLTEVSTS